MGGFYIYFGGVFVLDIFLFFFLYKKISAWWNINSKGRYPYFRRTPFFFKKCTNLLCILEFLRDINNVVYRDVK